MSIQRRSFLKTAAAVLPAAALGNLAAEVAAPNPTVHVIATGQDRFGPARTLGFSSLAFKAVPEDTGGNLLLIEHRNLLPDTGPPLHLHPFQEEWFYVMEGQVAFQVGDKRVQLKTGECVLGPRGIPHTFSAVDQPAHMLIAFSPAGKMEQYFIGAAAHPEMAGSPDFLGRCEVKWIGPSPFWKSSKG